MEAAPAFAGDADYAPHGQARRAGTDSRFCLIDDTGVAGSIPYLPKGSGAEFPPLAQVGGAANRSQASLPGLHCRFDPRALNPRP